MEVDKYYQDMIDNILNGTSDREQLEIILKLVSGLKEWNKNCDMYCKKLYYKELSQIEKKIIKIKEKEDLYNDRIKIKSIKLNLDENNDIQSVEVEDINNKIEHYFNEETDEEKEEYYNSTLRDIIKDYVDYLERNREEVLDNERETNY